MERLKFEKGLSELGFRRTEYSNVDGVKKKSYVLEKAPIGKHHNYRTIVITDNTGYRIIHWYDRRGRVERSRTWKGIMKEKTALAVFKEMFRLFGL